MIVNHTLSGEIHSRYDMDTNQIEMTIATNTRTVHMEREQAVRLIVTLTALIRAHDIENSPDVSDIHLLMDELGIVKPH